MTAFMLGKADKMSKAVIEVWSPSFGRDQVSGDSIKLA